MKKRVAAVGLHHTGTRTLTYIFEEKLGYKRLHRPKLFSWEAYKMLEQGRSIFSDKLRDVEFMSDLFYPSTFPVSAEYSYLLTQEFRSQVVKALAEEGVRFIINIRDVESLINSRIKYRLEKGDKKIRKGDAVVRIDRAAWRREYQQHYTFLADFLKDKDHIYLNICDGDKPAKLFNWLGVEPVVEEFPIVGKSKLKDYEI